MSKSHYNKLRSKSLVHVDIETWSIKVGINVMSFLLKCL